MNWVRRRTVVLSGRGSLAARAAWTAAFVLLAVVRCGAQTAAASHFVVNAQRSSVHFFLGGVHEVNGVFQVTSGDVAFNRANGQMSGTIVVDAASANSDNSSRDKKIRKDEMKAGKFPNVTFAPSGFTGTLADSGTSQIQVKGTFTLLGQPHEITVPMTVTIDGDHLTAKGSFTVPYVEWGMKNPSVFLLKMDKEVKVSLDLAGQIVAGS